MQSNILCLLGAIDSISPPDAAVEIHCIFKGRGSVQCLWVAVVGSCLKTGQHFIFAIINLLLPIKCIIFDSVSKILFFLLPIIMILIMKILLHNEYKIINLWYPTYVYPFLIFLIITKIDCWPFFKQDPSSHCMGTHARILCNIKQCCISDNSLEFHFK